MNFLKIISPLVLIIAGFVASAIAQEAQPSPSPAISEEKRALIKQFIELTVSRQSVEALYNAQFDEMARQLPDLQWQSISSLDEFKKLTPQQQQEVHVRVKESSDRLTRRVKELFQQRIDMVKMVEDISYELYNKHFTEAELQGLVTFYKSDLGRKVVNEMPAVFGEATTEAGRRISPQLSGILEQVEKEQAGELEKEITGLIKESAKPPAKKPATTRRRH